MSRVIWPVLTVLVASNVVRSRSIDVGLRDNPIAGSEVQYLDGIWKLRSSHIQIKGSVPGDLLTDLQTAGLIGDPLYEVNFQNSTLWDDRVWVYSTVFDVPASQTLVGVRLVFDGIKMGARVKFNGRAIGQAVDQFLRYDFLLKPQRKGNIVEVEFDPDMDADGRFMACSGGWDWAPYTTTREGRSKDVSKAATFSKGIWKSVYVVYAPIAALDYVVPQIFYLGEYPLTRLQPREHGNFVVNTSVHISTPSTAHGRLSVQGSWGGAASKEVQLRPGKNRVVLSLLVKSKEIELWWPSGLGSQQMYNVDVTYTSPNSQVLARTSRRIGFRYVALVTSNESSSSESERFDSKEGSGHHGMYIRVNGVALWARGANMIPMEELEGRMSAAAHRLVVKSAVDANMNMLRVWGGGIFLPQVWYDACDAMGIMVYHDMQYAQSGHSPKATTTQRQELVHQVQRLSSHPSIVLWDGCNECQVRMGTSTEIYASFVLQTVAEVDKSRPIWPSCPAIGWTSGVRRKDSLPTGKKILRYFAPDFNRIQLSPNLGSRLVTPSRGPMVEVHGPYMHGSGFPAVNGMNQLSLFSANLPVRFGKLDPSAFGVEARNFFASEYGCSAMSSFESMSPLLHPSHWSLHGGEPADKCLPGFSKQCTGKNPMAQRNYPCDNIIAVYFGEKYNLSEVGERAFKTQLYLCMMGQALYMKSTIEHRRSRNELGSLGTSSSVYYATLYSLQLSWKLVFIVWQLNEIWPTGGWGSLEYGTPVPGQVIGGRWKPLHYWYAHALFKDVIAVCGAKGLCYVRNDGSTKFRGSVKVESVSFSDSSKEVLYERDVRLRPGPASIQYFSIPEIDGKSRIAMISVKHSCGLVANNNFALFEAPKDLNLPRASLSIRVRIKPSVTKTVAQTVNASLEVTASRFALFVVLSTQAQGRFSDNAFILRAGEPKTVEFIPFVHFGEEQRRTLVDSLRAEHFAHHNKTQEANIVVVPADTLNAELE